MYSEPDAWIKGLSTVPIWEVCYDHRHGEVGKHTFFLRQPLPKKQTIGPHTVDKKN